MTARFPAADIDLNALQHNLACVRTAAPDSKIMAVLKANAYGHDLMLVAAALGSADALAVARVGEGAEIRSRGFQNRIVVLEGVNNKSELATAARYRLELVVHQREQLSLLEDYAGDHRFVVWLKINSGMNRLGVNIDDARNVVQQLSALANIVNPVNQMTHLACADFRDDVMTRRQIDRFNDYSADAEGECSIANSAALLAWPDSHADWVRPGIMLYGISPFAEQNGSDLGLKPAMHLRSQIIAKHIVEAGDSVGYGAEWSATEKTCIATAAAGYGDGYPARVPVGSSVRVNGRNCPVVGRVSMDMMALDLGPNTTDELGDEVTLWGPELPVETLARKSGRLSYELVCSVSQRVPRRAIRS